MIHHLKTWPVFFAAQSANAKQFEIRKDDRDYRIGNTFVSQEWLPEEARYSGREIRYTITYILRNAPDFGLMLGYCVLSLQRIEETIFNPPTT